LSHKIMVVDDNSVTRRMVRNALQRNGHDVLEAPDGKTARELMERWHPRVVIQDLMLPDADGFALVGELRLLAHGNEVSILAFSGFVSELDEARVSSVGFDDIIPKPIAPSRLVPLVEAHLPANVPKLERFGDGRRLVIADDDPMQLKLAQFRLSRLGFEIEAVSDGRAALEAIRRRPPDIIVSDVMMPEIDGFALAMSVRQDPKLRRLPVVLVTSSYVETADRDLAKRAGANDLVPRTPDLTELVDKLRETLESKTVEPMIEAEQFSELEKEHNQRVFRQLERQVMLNSGLAKRCSALASELTVLTGISEAVLKHRDVDIALDESLAECFDAVGISIGALYLIEGDRLRVRPIGSSTGAPAIAEIRTFYGHEKLLRDLIARKAQVELPLPLGEDRDAALAAAAPELLARSQGIAMMLVPVVHLEHALGTLMMVARGRELDREDWRAFAHGVATQVSHVLTLARAFADREVAERKATDHAALLDAVLESAPDFVFHLALDGTVLFANRVDPRFEGRLLGSKLEDTLSAEQKITAIRTREIVLATGQPHGYDSSIQFDGRVQWFSSRIAPVRQQGEITGFVVISRDITESKQTEMHLMVADRMASVGTLAAGVAHEINNPLASVIANLDMALQDVTEFKRELPVELAEELQDARTAADRVREIVRDLKIFSRTEEERRGPVDIEHVLESTIRMAWNELRHRARLVKKFEKVPDVDANESRLGQVFLNLIINAAHAIPPGKYETNQIVVSTFLDATRSNVIIAIRDTGAGIPPEVRPRLFTPFFTTKPVGVGTGLGLAISHKIVTGFGGTVTYETEVGKGTEFRVSLPVAGVVEIAKPRTKSNKTRAARRGRILVVDDEEPLAQAIRRFLSTEHDVTAVFSAGAALELIRGGERYDVVFCDLMMPQITGMEMHAELVRTAPDLAQSCVFLTGGAFTSAAREFLDQVPNRRLEKPFDLKELRRMVNELIR
jgi:PAS domain S-box-containing protein